MSGRREFALHAVVVSVAVGLAIHTGLGITGGLSRELVVLPLVGVVGLAVAALALSRFEIFVLCLLTLRTSAEAGKLAESGTSVLDPSSLLAVLFLLAAIPWMAAQRRAHGADPGSPIGTALALFLVAGLLSVLSSTMPATSLIEWGRMAAAASMFFVLTRLLRRADQLRRTLIALALSSVIPILVALYGAVAGGFSEQKGDFTRITSTFQQSNGFSRYLMLVVVVSVAVLRYVSPRVRIPVGLLAAGASVALLLTYTRSAWLATAAALFTVGALGSRRLLGGMVVVGLVVLVAVPSVSARFSDLFTNSDPEAAQTHGNSLAWRFGYWTEIIPLAADNPITGIGLRVTGTLTDEGKEPHNDFLRAYLETGLLGLAAYTALIVALVRTARNAVRRASAGFPRGVALGFAGVTTGFILVSVVSNVISQLIFLWYFFALAAAAEAISRHGGVLPEPDAPESAEPVTSPEPVLVGA